MNVMYLYICVCMNVCGSIPRWSLIKGERKKEKCGERTLYQDLYSMNFSSPLNMKTIKKYYSFNAKYFLNLNKLSFVLTTVCTKSINKICWPYKECPVIGCQQTIHTVIG